MWRPSNLLWQVLIDFVGTLSESHGFKQKLLIGNHLSKWYEDDPMQNQESKTVAKSVADCWISKFGCPAKLHSQKGKKFMSIFFKNICEELGIYRSSTIAYHPQRN